MELAAKEALKQFFETFQPDGKGGTRLQAFLRAGYKPEDLEEKLAIKFKRHGKHPNLVQFKYNQIETPMDFPLAQECRGIILDETDNWKCIARPFDKFFNLGEPMAANVDWKSARSLEKLDGSLMIVYHYKGEMHVASSGTPDACGPVGDVNTTFKDLFWKTFYDAGYMVFGGIDPNHTYMFELMTPLNRVVIAHPKPRLVLIGVRNPRTGEEINIFNPMLSYTDRFEVVKDFGLQTTDQITASFEKQSGLDQEGYVVLDKNFNRVKVKHPRYVLFHQMVGSLSTKKVLEAWRTGETPEVLTYFPQWKQEFETVGAKYEALISKIETEYAQIRDIPVQKDFALRAVKTTYSPALFAIRAGKYKTFREFFGTLRLDSLCDLLELKEQNEVPTDT